ncbi:HAD family hydrolase [Oculatella sp. LEGE 06141]|uniref:HAD family hydrolase n=1 Tax=Oculatella sp. LEGE 06141 TaxID=1828648 RepID=UPI001881BDD3|nr:HAD hydrolase-like protein [Oculatella sp. LEGE 06141]MBE9180773.1 HAD family hydrolase [Oculatella sp. LEGE 06141]
MSGAANSDPLQTRPFTTGLATTADVTVFCDFDGPIVDVSDRYYSTYQLALAELQASYRAKGVELPVHLLSKVQFWQMKQDRVPDLEIAMRSGLRYEQVDLFLHHVSQIVNQPELLSHDRLQPAVEWALSLLHTQGIRLVLVTLRCQAQATQMLKEYGLDHLFLDVIGTEDQHAAYRNYAEQKAELLAEAIARRKIHHSNTSQSYCNEPSMERSPGAWMVGDTEADILAGQAVGIPTIGLTCGIRSRSYLERFSPDHIHSDLLSAVHYLIRHHFVPCAAYA